ncbi:MAG: DUF3888 domain-containing protein [Firmicutes bacterium]|nr:DUF3888 domain-containing protein [Bacillota bacterium]
MLENRKLIIVLLCVNAFLTLVLIFSTFQVQPTETKVEYTEDPLAELRNKIILTMLQDSIGLAVRGHYQTSDNFDVVINPYRTEILDLQDLGKGVANGFLVKVKVISSTGTNQQLGEDHLTFQITSGNIKLMQFQHIKDFPLPNTLE